MRFITKKKHKMQSLPCTEGYVMFLRLITSINRKFHWSRCTNLRISQDHEVFNKLRKVTRPEADKIRMKTQVEVIFKRGRTNKHELIKYVCRMLKLII